MTFVLTAAPLYLTYKMYRAGVESEARQGAILEAAHDAILTIDGQLKIREFNPAAEKMFGYERLDVLGKNVDMLTPGGDRTSLGAALGDYLRTGRGPLANRQLELRALKEDGTEFPVELTVARMGGERSAELAAFVRDITERRDLEEQLRQSQKLEAIGRLAGGVAHDFNNILMSIMGAADLLLLSLKGADPARDEADEIKQAVVRGAGLTRQLLAFSRRQATSPHTFVLGDAVHGMESMLRRLIGPEIDLTIVSTGDPVTVHADVGQIEQVLLNLVINARDAMPSGGRLVVKVDEVELNHHAAATLAEGKPGTYARLSVSDTGTGMDDTTRARLFEPFFTTKEQGKGTGLGLSIVYGIVRQSGGYITVRSEIGRGTTFFLYFPTIETAEPAAATV
jgi:PAS domain S-box-containing protein